MEALSDDDEVITGRPDLQIRLNLSSGPAEKPQAKPLAPSNRTGHSVMPGPFEQFCLVESAPPKQQPEPARALSPQAPRKRKRLVKLRDIPDATSPQPSPSPMRIRGRQRDSVILSDSEDDQRVPDTLGKAAPEAKAVGLPSVAKAESPAQWPADASARLRNAGDNAVDLAEEPEDAAEDGADHVLDRCEAIAGSLRQLLGQHQAAQGASSAEAVMVTHEALISACGEAVRCFKGYQLVGVNYLALLARSGIGGAIMADEMGLGKTAQAIAFLGVRKALDGDGGPHLVIVPASLLENWQRELAKWCPGLRVVTYYGKERWQLREELKDWRRRRKNGGLAGMVAAQQQQQQSTSSLSELDDDLEDSESGEDDVFDMSEPQSPGFSADCGAREAPFNVLLTTYTLFERDSHESKLDRAFLKLWQWSCLVLDEAHAVKNRNARRTTHLNRVAVLCKRRIMLTGTPLQNDLQELQNLLGFLLPDIFREEDAAQLSGVQDEEELETLTQRMKTLLGPFVLRRLKADVAGQLAPKDQRLTQLSMTPIQADMYTEAVQRLRKQAVDAGLPDGTAGVSTAKLTRKLGKQGVTSLFTDLRKIAQHPLLMPRVCTDDRVLQMAKIAHPRGIFGDTCTLEQVQTELLGYSDFSLHCLALNNAPKFSQFLLDPEHLIDSAKCRALAELLPKLKEEGHHPLIFSQWTSVLDILEWLLERLQLPYLRLDGSTAVADRLALVDKFNDPSADVFAFLLSTRAGGQGLNLTRADTVILHDVDFNPQIDRQAEDRCHRLGQQRTVVVHRLVTQGTVDEGIHAMAERKLRLDAAVLDGVTAAAEGKAAGTAAATVQMSELLQSLLARTTGPDGTSTESRETHGQDDREEHPANKEAGTRVELVDLT
ncbi:hypothetical protein CVIRNUC_006835 [Coccomyxa viridis]|uniref:Uncharacterized protein n=1 Tax=Coccomyxa viridis TaxID=1274662 RepID=A0AAV1IA84_9CHLO|nr:hypothetical protein CVIRNUC_006835 [Coccomyxa viridis]